MSSLIVGYPNAVTGTKNKRAAQSKGARLTIEWMQKIAKSLPTRCTPIAAGDFNTGFGRTNGEDWLAGVGDYNIGECSA